jgi:hypothetical protein
MLKLMTRGALACVGAAVLAAGAAAQTVAISTLPPGAINHVQAAAIAKVIQENTDLQMRLVTFNAPAAIFGAAQNKQAEFAYTSNEESGAAFAGVGDYEGRAMPDLRVAFTVFPFRVGLIVRNKSDIKTVADLKGKRAPTEWTAFRQGIALMQAQLLNGGLTLNDVVPVPTTGLLPQADDFKAGKTDVFTFAVGGPKVAEIHASIDGGVRFLSFEDSPAALARMQKIYREYHVASQQPAPHLAGIIGPTNLMQYYIVFLTHKDTPGDLVKKVLKAVSENKAGLVAGHPSFAAFTPEGMAVQHPRLEYHPAAIEFYKAKGIWTGS